MAEFAFAFDIETVPNMNLVDCLPEPKVKLGQLKDPKKIKEKTEAAKKKMIEDMALSPLFGRICSFAVYGSDGLDAYHVVDEISDAEEIIIIKLIFNYLTVTGKDYPTIITWNGYNFDIPFLYTRASILKVEMPTGALLYSQMCKRYYNHPHCDLKQVLSNWIPNKYVSLKVTSKIYGVGEKIDIDYSKFIEMIEQGKGDEIGIYNLVDAELIYKIHEAMKSYFI